MTIAHPCDEVEPFAPVEARANAALEQGAWATYVELGRALEQSLRCELVEDPARGLDMGPRAATLLTRMGDAAFETETENSKTENSEAARPEPARPGTEHPETEHSAQRWEFDTPSTELRYRAHLVYAHLTARELDPIFAVLQLDALEHALGSASSDEPGPRLTCKTNSEGVCVYRRDRVKKPGFKPYPPPSGWEPAPRVPTDNARLRAYTLYLRDASDRDPARTEDLRYRLIRLLLRYGPLDEARAQLTTYLQGYPGTARATFAAVMLADVLTVLWLDAPSDDEQLTRGQALLDWLDAARTQAWWSSAEARPLREAEPLLRAGLMWRAASYYEQRGKIHHDAQDLQRCRDGYVAIREAFEEHDRADELLYRAAGCAELAHDLDDAIALQRRLLDAFPDSERAQRILYYLGDDLVRSGQLRAGMDVFVRYDEYYPKDELATHLLERAIELARLLGDREAVVEIAERYESKIMRKDVREAARIRWAARPPAGPELARYAQPQLERYGSKWLPGNFEARFVLGESALVRSCPSALDEGLCLRDALERSCCGLHEAYPRPRTRRARALEEAQSYLRALQKLPVNPHDHPPAELERLYRARSAARVLELDLELERALTTTDPLTPEHEHALDGLAQAYAALAQDSETHPESVARAHARRGLLWELRATMIAMSAPTPDAPELHCERLRQRAREPLSEAIAAYEACVAVTVAHGHFDANAHSCERALASIDPAGHALGAELLPAPRLGPAPLPLQRAGVQAPDAASERFAAP